MMMVAVLMQMLMLAPLRGDADTMFRSQIAHAIAEGTDDVGEQLTLAKIGWHEGSYSRRVASCAVLGDGGKSHGLFQIQPKTPLDKREACGTLDAQVRVALRFIRRSIETCAENVGSAKLNVYTSGRCDRGYAASAKRWGMP
jgi:hypothetical protein